MKTEKPLVWGDNFWAELFKKRPDLDPPGYNKTLANLETFKNTVILDEVESEKYPINTKVLVMDLETGEWEGPYSVKSAINEKGYLKVQSRQLKSTIMVRESQLRTYVT
jgi:hypothetical protein